jgi:hypothetical protein
MIGNSVTRRYSFGSQNAADAEAPKPNLVNFGASWATLLKLLQAWGSSGHTAVLNRHAVLKKLVSTISVPARLRYRRMSNVGQE